MRVAFIFAEYSLHNHIIERYAAERPDDAISIIKVPLVLKGKSRVDTASNILPRLSRRFVASKVLEFFVLLFATIIPKLLDRGAVFRRLRSIAKRHGFPFHVSRNVTSFETLSFLKGFEPDLIVTMFHQILKGEILTIASKGVVNIHPGILPDFKGIQPYFWELSEGSPFAGATLHLIEDEGIDTGGVLAKAVFPVPQHISVHALYYLTAASAAQVLPEVLRAYAEGDIPPKPQISGEGSYYRWPDSAAYDRLCARGHSLFSFVDLWRVLTGHFDSFRPEKVIASTKHPPSL